MNRIGHVAAGTAVFLLTSLGIATGQERAPSPMQPMPQGRMMGPDSAMPMAGGSSRMGMTGMMGMADHVAGRIAFLKAELKITEAQTPQWNAFADALRSDASRMSGMRATMMQGGMMGQDDASASAPDRLDRMEKMMSAMLETVKATKAALAPLYAVLTEEQKKMADQLIHGPMGMGRM
jgi:LTXXQ motif family protein